MRPGIAWLRVSYWIGAVVDGAMIVALLSPSVGAALLGLTDFHPGPEYRYATALAASLMAGWTALLVWADRKPVERRGVLLLTICPVLLGLMASGGYAVASGLVAAQKMGPTWALQLALVVIFSVSYVRAGSG